MKTLNEEIQAIKAAKTSLATKKAALAKLGVTPYEIAIVLSDVETPTRGRFTFGVEMECFVAPGSIRTAAAETGMAYQYERYNHNDGHAHFKFTTDASVRGYADPVECVSPVLNGSQGQKALKNACKTLNMAGARVNHTCGLHVHIGAANLNEQQYANVFYNYAMLEHLIDSFMASSRRDNRYAHTLRDHVNELRYCTTREAVQRYLNYDRYHKVNPQSYRAHKTIEFRQHQGTTNYQKIMNWVMFCGKLVLWSKKNRLQAAPASIDDIPFLTAKEKSFFKARVNEMAR